LGDKITLKQKSIESNKKDAPAAAK